MRELRRGDAEGFENQEVLEGVGEVILAANDVADAQVGVVHAGGQMVGGVAIRAKEREIFHLVGELGLRAVDAVNEMQRPLESPRHAVAQRKRLAGAARRSDSSRKSSRMPGLKSHAPCAEDCSPESA